MAPPGAPGKNQPAGFEPEGKARQSPSAADAKPGQFLRGTGQRLGPTLAFARKNPATGASGCGSAGAVARPARADKARTKRVDVERSWKLSLRTQAHSVGTLSGVSEAHAHGATMAGEQHALLFYSEYNVTVTPARLQPKTSEAHS